MKGDVARDITCPIDGMIMHPRVVRGVSIAYVLKRALRGHILTHHPEMKTREISLFVCGVVDAMEAK